MMAHEHDFIIVGGGASGCVLASRLADAPFKPSVLLLEAGGANDGTDHMSGYERFKPALQKGSPLNWGFKTAPQEQLDGREIDYARGRGLGGSTAINFCAWVVGPDEDYNEWSRRVGDEDFAWENAKRCFKKVEKAHFDVPAGFEHLIRPKEEDHGLAGPVDVSYQDNWVGDIKDIFTAAEQVGVGVNPDVNSGNPMGVGLAPLCIYNGLRVTASTAYLSRPRPNLTVLPNAHVSKVILDGKTAKGVSTVDGREFLGKEVILSAGALQTPQILLLSGIGPADELEAHKIEMLHELPQVGRNLQDHCSVGVGIVVKRTQDFMKQQPSPMGWLKTPRVFQSSEFRDLPDLAREHLQRPRIPHLELITHTMSPFLGGVHMAADEQCLASGVLLLNAQSRGTVTLRSADPLEAPVIDPRFLTHPYDRRAAIEVIRRVMEFFDAPVLKEKTLRPAYWPRDDSDDAIWEHITSHLRSSWHMCGTAVMGGVDADAKTACVDSSFRVLGLKGLRVVDLSVLPLVPNNHTQTTAYVVGEIAAEKLIREYGQK